MIDDVHARRSAAVTAPDHAASLRLRLAAIRLCVLLDTQVDAAAFERLVASLLAAGVRMFQIRDKAAPDPLLLDRAERAALLARRADAAAPALITVNDRVTVAAAAGIDGVHIGAEDMPVAAARDLLGPAPLIGSTAHDLAEAREAVAAGTDSLGIGPCYPSITKAFARRASAEFLRGCVSEHQLPIFAIGGITPERIPELAELGIHRIAVSAAITAAPDPATAARAFLAALDRG